MILFIRSLPKLAKFLNIKKITSLNKVGSMKSLYTEIICPSNWLANATSGSKTLNVVSSDREPCTSSL